MSADARSEDVDRSSVDSAVRTVRDIKKLTARADGDNKRCSIGDLLRVTRAHRAASVGAMHDVRTISFTLAVMATILANGPTIH